MDKFATLLVGSAMLAAVAFSSWLVGLLMGFGIGRGVRKSDGKHKDVDELLARERGAATRAAGNAPVPAARASAGPSVG